MPTTAIKSTFLTTVHPFSLYIRGGLDVLKEPGTPGTSFGTPIESIHITEAGPGGVSSLDFAIDDPLSAIRINDGDDVQYMDNTTDKMLFRGYVDHTSFQPSFAGQGRVIVVSCTGVEVWLDWVKIVVDQASPTFPDFLAVAISKLAQLNAPMLRSPFDPIIVFGMTRRGSFSWPIGTLGAPYIIQTVAPVLFGSTMREAITSLWNNSMTQDLGLNPVVVPPPILVTVDFYMGLRVWEDVSTYQPDDYTTLTISDTAAGTIAAEGLDYTDDPGDPIRAVYVSGGNAAGTGLFGDGSGITGRTEILTDATILDAATAAARAAKMIAANSATVRGVFSLTDFTPAATVHAGSLVTITDAAAGLSGSTYRIYQIDKTFLPSGRQTWKVGFGGPRPSAIKLLRKLTRAVSI